MLLDEIIENKKNEVYTLKEQFSKFIKLKNLAAIFPPIRDFKAAISKKDKIALIAEVKKASPSSGVIVKDFEPAKIAGTYEKSGAAALSVLTDAKYFQGMLTHLKTIKEAAKIPVLRKDFIIDEIQIIESRLAGADALLLIARILSSDQMKSYLEKCEEFKLSALVEIHDEKDAEKALSLNAKLIGINNRDLDSLKVDLNTSLRLVTQFPELKARVLVSESGIATASQVKELHSAGFSAVLIGDSLLKSNNIEAKIKELISN